MLSVSPCSSIIHDVFYWHYENDDHFIVKSSCKVGCVSASVPFSSNPCELAAWWKVFWMLQIPPKAKLFFPVHMPWLVANKCEFSQTYVPISPLCSMCKCHRKSNLYALWSCPLLKSICYASRFSCGSLFPLALSFRSSCWFAVTSFIE
ncbi:hypothetical protein ACOSQ4_024157 [Xanthoceras sorbifolium]